MSTVFAIDTSGRTVGVCVRQGGNVLFCETLDEGLRHSVTLLPLVRRAFDACGLPVRDVDVFAVTAGPGSFTGLRIGMAMAKGLALPDGIPVAAVSTLEAVARAGGETGVVVPALDARRGEVYCAAFDMGTCKRLLPDMAVRPEELKNFLDPVRETVFFVGDGAEICYNNLGYGHISSRAGAALHIAAAVAAIGEELLGRGETVDANAARIGYLRLSQAERERAARMGHT